MTSGHVSHNNNCTNLEAYVQNKASAFQMLFGESVPLDDSVWKQERILPAINQDNKSAYEQQI